MADAYQCPYCRDLTVLDVAPNPTPHAPRTTPRGGWRSGSEDWTAKGPATEEQLAAAESVVGRLPDDYRAFLRETNGGAGSIGNTFLDLWPVAESARYASVVSNGVPDLVVIGSDGGGETFGFDTRQAPYKVVMVPAIAIDWEDAMLVASSFEAFWRGLHEGHEPFEGPFPDG